MSNQSLLNIAFWPLRWQYKREAPREVIPHATGRSFRDILKRTHCTDGT